MRDIFILIPAFNEEATIFNVVQSCVAIAREVIVVNDGSTDETGNLARKAGATVIDKSKNEGYESALNTGFKFAVERLGDASSLVTFADSATDQSGFGTLATFPSTPALTPAEAPDPMLKSGDSWLRIICLYFPC